MQNETTVKRKRLVVGLDFSAASFEAAHWAARHFARGAELVLSHIIALPHPPPIVSSRFPRRDLLIDTLREGAEKRLRELSLSLASDRTWLEIREGEPAECLANLADEYSADLIIIGTHGEHAAQTRLGSTAETLVRIARVPVLLATKNPAGPPTNILVAMDGTAGEAGVLTWAAALRGELDVRVTGVQVFPSKTSVPAGQRDDALAVRIAEAGVPMQHAKGEIAFGDVLQELMAAADRHGSDLIIAGRRRKGDFRRTLLGSVVDGLLRGANCPLLIVPEITTGPTARAAET